MEREIARPLCEPVVCLGNLRAVEHYGDERISGLVPPHGDRKLARYGDGHYPLLATA